MPAVIKLSRARGWRMPENTVKVDRATKWGNPFPTALAFRNWLELGSLMRGRQPVSVIDLAPRRQVLLDSLHELWGKNLACWCHDWDGTGENPMVCHADVLLRMANGKFQVGDRVRVFQLLDPFNRGSNTDLIGMEGTIREVDPLVNGHYNYCMDGRYMHEEELELVTDEQ